MTSERQKILDYLRALQALLDARVAKYGSPYDRGAARYVRWVADDVEHDRIDPPTFPRRLQSP